jgi:YidC/Oxa1 family membrane protein insertase
MGEFLCPLCRFPLPLPPNLQQGMKMDKNTVIGFGLMFVLFIGYFWYSNRQFAESQAWEKHKKDSIARVEAVRKPVIDKAAAYQDSLRTDSLSKSQAAAGFMPAGREEATVLENDVLKATFTNNGGKLKSVELKKYKSYDSTNVVLNGNASDKLFYTVNTAAGKSAPVSDLAFDVESKKANADGSQTIVFKAADSAGKAIYHQFTLHKADYLIDWNIRMEGASQLLSSNTLNINWNITPVRHENSLDYERRMTQLAYLEDNNFDYDQRNNEIKFEKPVQWFGAVQQFFNTTIISKNGFQSGNVSVTRFTDSSNNLTSNNANFQLKLPATNTQEISLQLYMGPNEYKTLQQAAPDMDKIVNLGRGIYSFVRPINKFIIMPVFNFFASFMINYGWVVLLLTLFIRLITSPLTYKSYLSSAKMKVLRPELDALKKKYGDDQQGYAMEQMKVFREAGVSPLGGCLPALLQIPIFFALYSFFNSAIALRGQSFLWAADLSQSDIIAKLPFNFPGLGNHISLFMITAVVTNFFISIYNAKSTPDQGNPALKYMPYIFPFVLIFVFNSLPSALTWYYTCSNLITLAMQFVIQNYIIDHNKILAEMEVKRKQPKQKSKWQNRLEQMQQQQKQMQEMRNKKN